MVEDPGAGYAPTIPEACCDDMGKHEFCQRGLLPLLKRAPLGPNSGRGTTTLPTVLSQHSNANNVRELPGVQEQFVPVLQLEQG